MLIVTQHSGCSFTFFMCIFEVCQCTSLLNLINKKRGGDIAFIFLSLFLRISASVN